MNIRISENLKKWIVEEAKKNEMTITAYVKMLLLREKNKKEG